MRKRAYSCTSCLRSPLEKDEVGASKKLLGSDTNELYCIDCLASYLEVTAEDILQKIEQFKEEGCTLFS